MRVSRRIIPKLVLALTGVALFVLVIWLFQQKKTVTYSGLVVDHETGHPVPNAKVVLSTWHHGIMDSSPVNVGTFTDENGRFTVSASPDYWIARVDLAASSPESLYCHLHDPRESDEVLIKVSPLESRLADIDAYEYKNFRGAYHSRHLTWLPKK